MTIEPAGDAPEGATGSETLELLAGVFDDNDAPAPKAKSDTKKEDAQPVEAEASDDEPEEAEAEEGDAEEEADDETGADEEQPQTFRVKVDGAELEVTLDELTRGYSREADYTRKTMALGDAERAQEAKFAAEKETVAKEREQYKAVLDYWAKQINEQMGSSEDLERLRNSPNMEDRQEYAIRIADQVRFREKLGAIEAETKRLKDKETEEKSAAEKVRITEEGKKLIAAVPEWKDQAKWKVDGDRIYSYANTMGIGQEELNRIADHRVLRVLHDAARYRELQSKKIEPVRKAQTVQPARPGAVSAQPNANRSKSAKAEQRLKSSGRVEDLADVFQARGIA